MATATAEPAGNGLAPPETEPVPATTNANASSETNPSPQTEPPVPATEKAPPAATAAGTTTPAPEKKWPGWPGDCVFRLVVPVLKVGSIIGRKGEIIKKTCEETKARIRVLEGAVGTADRIVLVSGKEEPEAELSPAMDAVLRIFKRVNGLSEGQSDAAASVPAGVPCSIRLLVASSQAINLIGKQGSLIKSIQEGSSASVRVLSENEVPFYASPDERIVEIQGEPTKVLKALEAVVGHLRKFLVDHSVIPLFEKSYNMPVTQDRAGETLPHTLSQTGSQVGLGTDYSHSLKRDSLYLDREAQLDSQVGLSLYGQDPTATGLRSSGFGRTTTALVTQITQTMQIPLSYAEDIIGVGGANIGYIRRTSGAILTVQESRGAPDEITVEIKGNSSQVQAAQQLIQEFIAGHKEPAATSYGKIDSGMRSYSQLPNPTYPPPSLPTQPIGGYGSSGLGYSNYRM